MLPSTGMAHFGGFICIAFPSFSPISGGFQQLGPQGAGHSPDSAAYLSICMRFPKAAEGFTDSYAPNSHQKIRRLSAFSQLAQSNGGEQAPLKIDFSEITSF